MRPLKNPCEVTVIGGGLAGLAAARHAARLGRLVTLLEATGLFGGLVATLDEVDGLPVPGKFSGQDLAMHLLEDARKIGVRIIEATAAKFDPGKQLTLTDQQGRTYNPQAVIIASGATLRKLGVRGEEDLLGKGVSRCATCDGGFFRGQDVVVVGGGDAAVQEALILAKSSRRVTMVCRSPLKAKRDYIDRLAARENVSFIWDTEVSEILGVDTVAAVRLRNLKSGISSDIQCTGVFPFIGSVPNTTFVPAVLLTASQHVRTSSNFVTSDARVFAVGAARADYDGNVIEAMAEGVAAAQAASRLLLN